MNAKQGEAPSLAFGPFRLDVAGRRLTEAGRPVAMGDRALDLLIALTERPGELVTKAELISRVWPDTFVEEANLRVQISAIRRALGGPVDAYVANAPGRGYRFVTPVERQTLNGAHVERRSLWPSLSEPIGRADEIAAIPERIRPSRLLTIVGPGGIGKTTLALACARAMEGGYADGATFAEVAAGADQAMAVAASLGVRFPDYEGPHALAAYLAAFELLIVLDGCEYALDASARLIEAILREAPKVSVLATSREPLRAEGEVVWRIGPLTTPPHDQPLTAADAIDYPAVRLFVDRATAADRTFHFTDEEAPSVAHICRRLDGLPLAIELAAGRVGAFGLKGIEAGLGDRFRMLGEGRRTAVPRHRTLAAAVDWSYDALSADEQRGLRALSLFQSPFDAAAAAHVALGEESDGEAIYGLISSLVAKSLVVADTSRAPAEYRLLDTTREYAQLKLETSGELRGVAARHAARITQILAGAGSELEARSMRDWLEYFNRKLDDVRAALDWSYSRDGNPSFAVPLTLVAAPVWAQLDLYDETQRWIVAAMRIAEPDSPDEMRLCDALSVALTDVTNERARAEAAARRAISLAQRLEDRPAELRAEFSLWNTHISGGKVTAALDDLSRFSALAGSLGGAFEAVVTDRMACVTRLVSGDLAGSRAAIDRVLARSPARDARKKLAWFAYEPDIGVHNTEASLLWLEGKPDSAITVTQENLARAMATGNQGVMASVLADTACPIALSVGDLETAERHLAHLDMVVTRGAPSNLRAWAGVFRATLAAMRGDGSAGLALLNQGLPPDAEHPRFTSMLTELALRLGQIGAVQPARRLADKLLHRLESRGELWIWSEVQRVRGELLPDEGAATDLFESALRMASKTGARAWGLRAATSLAARQPNRAEAVLAPWLSGVTEGLWTRDVRAAQAILRQ